MKQFLLYLIVLLGSLLFIGYADAATKKITIWAGDFVPSTNAPFTNTGAEVFGATGSLHVQVKVPKDASFKSVTYFAIDTGGLSVCVTLFVVTFGQVPMNIGKGCTVANSGLQSVTFNALSNKVGGSDLVFIQLDIGSSLVTFFDGVRLTYTTP